MNLGIGVPSGTTCGNTRTNVQITGSAGLNACVTAAEQNAGQFCVIISDVGNLFARRPSPSPSTIPEGPRIRSLRCVVLCATVIVLARVPAAGASRLAAWRPNTRVSGRSNIRRCREQTLHDPEMGTPNSTPASVRRWGRWWLRKSTVHRHGDVGSPERLHIRVWHGRQPAQRQPHVSRRRAPSSRRSTACCSATRSRASHRRSLAYVIQRALTRRLSLSIAGDYMRSTLSFEPSALTALETTHQLHHRSHARTGSPTRIERHRGHDGDRSPGIADGARHRFAGLRPDGGATADAVCHRRRRRRHRFGEDADSHPSLAAPASVTGRASTGPTPSRSPTHTARTTRLAWAPRASPTTSRSALASASRPNSALAKFAEQSGRCRCHPFARKYGRSLPSLTFGNVPFNQTGPLNAVPVSETETRSGSGLERRGVVTTGFYLGSEDAGFTSAFMWIDRA